MPRSYSMERRAAQVAQTREQILSAALELFSERGAQGTAMNELARRADVSPTTVSNHFKTQESLIEAVVERIRADIRVPDSTIFVGARSVTARLRILSKSMFAFYGRTMQWFDVLGAELEEVPALARAQATFWRSIHQLYEQAIAGSVTDEAASVRVLACKALGRKPSAEGFEALSRAVTDDGDLDVRIVASAELVKFRDFDAP